MKPSPKKQRIKAPCSKLKKWSELELGAVLKSSGSSKSYKTGNWDPHAQVEWDPKTCINCNLCWSVCPDEAIITDEEGNMKGIDHEFCKSCGLCVDICPTKSLKMVEKKKEEV